MIELPSGVEFQQWLLSAVTCCQLAVIGKERQPLTGYQMAFSNSESSWLSLFG